MNSVTVSTRVAMYARVSSERQARDGTIDSQVEVSCSPKMSPLDDIESQPGKGCDEEAIYRRTDRGDSA
jgi:predicted site-specific integrase-resolvase